MTGSLLALGAPRVVVAGRVLVPYARVDHGELESGREFDQLGREIAQIDEQRRIASAVDRSELIEESRSSANEPTRLGSVRDAHDLTLAKEEIEQVAERPNDGDRERGARAKPRAERQGARDPCVEPGDVLASPAKLVRHSADTIGPASIPRLAPDRVADLTRCDIRIRNDPDGIVVALPCGDGDSELERDGEHETVVVVRVLADQVDPSGREPYRVGHRSRTIRGRGDGVRTGLFVLTGAIVSRTLRACGSTRRSTCNVQWPSMHTPTTPSSASPARSRSGRRRESSSPTAWSRTARPDRKIRI